MPFEPLERDERNEAIVFLLERADLQRPNDGWNRRRQAKQQLGFFTKLLEEVALCLLRHRARDLQALQRDVRAERGVMGAINDGEAALRHDCIDTECAALDRAD